LLLRSYGRHVSYLRLAIIDFAFPPRLRLLDVDHVSSRNS